ncbi:GGDEF domain-containing protein [Pseudoalteromonas sp. MMG005]|nr:GGDEF domain-containing protein [Pseudoalteromonas sp. MMG005]
MRSVFQQSRLSVCHTLLYVIVFFMCLHVNAGQPKYDLTQGGAGISRSFSYVETSDVATFDYVSTAKELKWQPHHKDNLNLGITQGTYWFRHTFSIHGNTPQDVIFEVSYPLLDDLQLFIEHDGKISSYQLGDLQPFSSRPIKHRFFLIPFVIRPHENVQLYARLKTSSVMILPIKLWKSSDFTQRNQINTLILGAYFGLMTLLFVYVFSCAVITRKHVYGYYLGYISSMTLLLCNLSGLSFQYFWPNSIWWNGQSSIFILYVIVLFGILFSRNLLVIEHAYPKFNRLLRYLTVAVGMMAIASLALPYELILAPTIYFSMACCVLGLVIGYLRVKDGLEVAKFYSIAWGGALFGGLVLVGTKISLVPFNWFTEHALMFGISFEILCLSFAIAKSLQIERKEKIALKDSLMTHMANAKDTLEQQVLQRTAELEKANIQLMQSSITDALTGVANRRRLDEFLDVEYARAVRFNYPICLLMIDVDYFKRVNDQYGHQVGDTCLKLIAERISNEITRVGDLVARYGGEEFCIVLPYTHELDGANIAQRIRESIAAQPIMSSAGPIELTISIGVAGHQPDCNMPLTQLELADKALYTAKRNGRNQVVMAGEMNEIKPR